MGLINGSRWKSVRGEFQHVFTNRATMELSPSISKSARGYVNELCPPVSAHKTVHAANLMAKFPFFCTAEAVYGPLSAEEKDDLWMLGQRNLALMRYVLAGGLYRFALSRLFYTGAARELDSFQRDWSAFNERIYQARGDSSSRAPITTIWESVKEKKLRECEVSNRLLHC